MEYFKLIPSLNKKLIGRYPQIKSCIIDTKYAKSFDERVFGSLREFKLKNHFILNKSAKPTDVIGEMLPYNILCSREMYKSVFKNLQEQHTAKETKIYNNEAKTNFEQTELVVKNIDKLKTFDYKMFQLTKTTENFIDFSKSIFCSIIYDDNYKEKIIEDNIILKNMKEYKHLVRKFRIDAKTNSLGRNKLRLQTKKICINLANFNKSIFKVSDNLNIGSYYTLGYYVSEKLKNEIEKQGFTGIEFIPLNKITTAFDIEIINNNS